MLRFTHTRARSLSLMLSTHARTLALSLLVNLSLLRIGAPADIKAWSSSSQWNGRYSGEYRDWISFFSEEES